MGSDNVSVSGVADSDAAGGLSDMDLALTLAQDSCLRRTVAQPYPDDGQLYCPPVWDGWGCWNYTLAGSTAYTPCPAWIDGFDHTLRATRECSPDGTWWVSPVINRTWSNYTSCINTGDLEKDKRLIYVFIAGYVISIVALFVSLVIFFSFRQLQCDRVTLHKNLFTSYILNGVAWILYYTLAALDVEVLTHNPIWCQALHVITQYLVTCNFFWMFCEGLYLHTIIVMAFTSGKKLLISCCIIGWVVPLIPTIIYTTIRANNTESCIDFPYNWQVAQPRGLKMCWTDYSVLQWIVFGPIVGTIIMNLIFLCNIVRVLVTKLRAVNSPDTNQSRKAARATLILIPLLGLQYILFPFTPDKSTIQGEIYLIASAFVTSFQGLFVALIFCFFNGEVISVMKRRWGQHVLMRTMSSGRRHSGALYTQTTMATSDHTATKSSSLHECKVPCGTSIHRPPALLVLPATPCLVRNGRSSDHKHSGDDDLAKMDIEMTEIPICPRPTAS